MERITSLIYPYQTCCPNLFFYAAMKPVTMSSKPETSHQHNAFCAIERKIHTCYTLICNLDKPCVLINETSNATSHIFYRFIKDVLCSWKPYGNPLSSKLKKQRLLNPISQPSCRPGEMWKIYSHFKQSIWNSFPNPVS